MKRILSTILFLIIVVISVVGQQVPREEVLLEGFTGTW